MAGADPRRWLILAVVALAQLMVVLDATIVNIALPSAQQALHFSDIERQWVVTAYALAFGSLLLLGGRLTDLIGRKATFIAGLIGFAGASAVGGAAGSFGMLVAARACQGAFGALLAPAALALLTTTFEGTKDRGKAFGVFGAIAGAGGAVGLLLGGLLTQYLDWRWCLYVNLVFAAIACAGAVVLLRRQSASRRPRLDLPGLVAEVGGMFCIVYGFSNAASDGWHAPATWGFLAAGAVLLAAFGYIETRARQPLLPLRIVLDRNRAAAYLSILITGAGMFGIFLFLTYYLQETLGFSPVMAGVAFLPMVGAIIVSANLANIVLLPRIGPRWLVAPGMLAAAAGLAWLTRIGVHSSYAADVLPPLLLTSTGLGFVMSPSMNTGTAGVAPSDAGAASAMVNTGQQVGGSIGTSLLNTDGGQRRRQLPGQPPQPPADGRRPPGCGAGRTGPGAQLHHRVLVGRRNVRGRVRPRRPALPPRRARRRRRTGGPDTMSRRTPTSSRPPRPAPRPSSAGRARRPAVRGRPAAAQTGGTVSFAGQDPIVPAAHRLGACIGVRHGGRRRGGRLPPAPRRPGAVSRPGPAPGRARHQPGVLGHLTLNQEPAATAGVDTRFLLTPYRTADGRWVMASGVYRAPGREVVPLPDVPPDAARVAAAIGRRDAFELEESVNAAGLPLCVVREPLERLVDPQGHLRQVQPVIGIECIGDAPARDFGPAQRPFDGVRVLSFTHAVAGPQWGGPWPGTGRRARRDPPERLRARVHLRRGRQRWLRSVYVDLGEPGRQARAAAAGSADVVNNDRGNAGSAGVRAAARRKVPGHRRYLSVTCYGCFGSVGVLRRLRHERIGRPSGLMTIEGLVPRR